MSTAEHIIGKNCDLSPETEVRGDYDGQKIPLYIEVGYEYAGSQFAGGPAGDWVKNKFYTVWVKVADYSFVGRAMSPRSKADFDHRAKICHMIQTVLQEHQLHLCDRVRLGCAPEEFYLRQD